VLALLAALGLSSLGAGMPPAQATTGRLMPRDGVYDVTVTRTKHGIPHVVARDWGSLGYGSGYATAQTSTCLLADLLLTAKGKRSRWLGPDGRYRDHVTLDASNLQMDTFVTDLRNRKVVEKLLADPVRGPGAKTRAVVRGYVAGASRYFKETGNLARVNDPACRGAAYGARASEIDFWYGLYLANLIASAGVFVPQITEADPPSTGDLGLPDLGALGLPDGISPADLPDLPLPQLDQLLPFSTAPANAPSAGTLRKALGKDPERGFGSNATALGSSVTTNHRGMLLGNPHFPWKGRYRFTQMHLTIPGVYDVAGAGLIGSPIVNIGFNKSVAWSHTVSTAYRFTPYEFRTLPGLPTRYLTDKGLKDLEKRQVSVTVKRPNGSLATVQRTLYRTDLGYVMDSPATLMGWTPASFFVMRDANAEHLRTLDSFLEMGRASSVRGLLKAQDATGGIPWVNTIAADRAGNVLYADHSVVPNVPNSLVDTCITPIGLITRQLAGLPVLDGTRAGSSCAWRNDTDAARPGVFGPRNLPATFSTRWVANANDSYWLPNDTTRLEGFASIIGCERCERTLRTRMVYRYVTDALKQGRISHRELAGFEHANRVYGAEVARANGDLQKVCAAAGGGTACDVLRRWDGRSNTSSVGTHIFEEFMRRAADPWAVPFDPADPLNTPRDLKESDPDVVQAMRDALASLAARDIPVNATWGSLQRRDFKGIALPVGGGTGSIGNANALGGDAPYSTSWKYPVNYGSSHIQSVAFTDRGVRGFTILTYGQSGDPTSRWSRDQTKLFGAERWVAFPFTKAAIARQKVSIRHLTASVG
jgi:acyl-homoserine-lactone acylase